MVSPFDRHGLIIRRNSKLLMTPDHCQSVKPGRLALAGGRFLLLRTSPGGRVGWQRSLAAQSNAERRGERRLPQDPRHTAAAVPNGLVLEDPEGFVRKVWEQDGSGAGGRPLNQQPLTRLATLATLIPKARGLESLISTALPASLSAAMAEKCRNSRARLKLS